MVKEFRLMYENTLQLVHINLTTVSCVSEAILCLPMVEILHWPKLAINITISYSSDR